MWQRFSYSLSARVAPTGSLEQGGEEERAQRVHCSRQASAEGRLGPLTCARCQRLPISGMHRVQWGLVPGTSPWLCAGGHTSWPGFRHRLVQRSYREGVQVPHACSPSPLCAHGTWGGTRLNGESHTSESSWAQSAQGGRGQLQTRCLLSQVALARPCRGLVALPVSSLLPLSR